MDSSLRHFTTKEITVTNHPPNMDITIEEVEEGMTSHALFEAGVGERDLSIQQHSVPTNHQLQLPIQTTNEDDRGPNPSPGTDAASTAIESSSSTQRTTTSQLCSTGGRSITWRTTQILSRELEEDHNSSMAIVSYRTRLPITVYEDTGTLEGKEKDSLTDRSISNRWGDQEVSGSRNSVSIIDTEKKFCVQLLYDPRANQTTSDPRLHDVESIFTSPTFQDGRDSSTEGFNRTRGLYDQDRPQGCICGGPNTPRITEIPIPGEQRYRIQLYLPSVRFIPSTEGIYQINALCGGTFTGQRDTSDLLLRRHLHIGEIQGQDGRNSTDSLTTPREPRFFNQQGEECFDPQQDAGIPRFQDQHKVNANFLTSSQDNQDDAKIQTIRSKSIQIMPLDCRIIGEDYRSDSSHGRSITAYPTYSEGSSKKSSTAQSSMGPAMCIIQEGLNGDKLVERESLSEERSSYQTSHFVPKSIDSIRRRLRFRMGSIIRPDVHLRLLERRRQEALNQRKRIDGNLLRHSSTYQRRQGKRNAYPHGQYHCPQVRLKSWRNFITSATRSRGKDPRLVQQDRSEHKISTHCGSQQHEGGQTEQSQATIVRINHPNEIFSTSEETMGKVLEGRCICSSPQSSTPNLLESLKGPVCRRGQCIPANVDKERPLHVSSLEDDSSGTEKVERRQDTRGNSNNPLVTQPILVPNVTPDETPESSEDLENPPVESSRMALINNKRKAMGMSPSVIKELSASTRPSTARIYDTAWVKYEEWCVHHKRDPTAYDTQQILEFLTNYTQFQVSTLNGYRSALASVLSVLYPEACPLAEHPEIVTFFRAKRRKTVKIPRLTEIETWDIEILVNYINQSLVPTETLNLYMLQQKLALLLCLHTMLRPRSDIGRLQWRDVILKKHGEEVYGVAMHIRQPKEAQQKTIQLGWLPKEKKEMCVLRCLCRFLQETQEIRANLPMDHTLLLTYLQESSERPPTSIAPATVAAWVRHHMDAAGLPQDYSPHSIRAAASTKAVQQGVSIDQVKQHANWSQTSNTFERYYYKPSQQQHASTRVQNQLFPLLKKVPLRRPKLRQQGLW